MIKYERIITDEEQKILEHDLLDINQWIEGMIIGKINNCKKRAAIACRELLKQEGAEMVPASDSMAVKILFEREDYANRVQRDSKEFNRDITKKVI